MPTSRQPGKVIQEDASVVELAAETTYVLGLINDVKRKLERIELWADALNMKMAKQRVDRRER